MICNKHYAYIFGFPSGSDDRESDCNAGNMSSGPWVRKIPWRRGMASHSSILAWRNP